MTMGSVWKLFCVLLVFHHLALGQSSQDLVLNGSVALESDFQKVTIECSQTGVLPFYDSEENQLFSNDGESSVYQSVEKPTSSSSGYELLINGSTLNSEIPTVINFMFNQVEEEGVRASFYVSKYENFYGNLVCNHLNQSRPVVSEKVASASLSLVYVTYKQEVSSTVWFYVATGIFILFLALLLLHVILACAMVKYFKRNHEHHILEDESMKRRFGAVSGLARCENVSLGGGKFVIEEKQLNSSCSDSSLSQEEATNALLMYLAHPTPCMEDSCPCYQYKEVLEKYKFASAKADRKKVFASNTLTIAASSCGVETDSCVSWRNNVQPRLLASKSDYLTSATSINSRNTEASKREVVYPNIHDNSSGTTPTDARDGPTYFVSPPDKFVVGSSGGSYSNEDHQVYLRVPEGAVPEGKTVSISIGIALTSSKLYLLPPKSQLVSPVVSFHVEGEKDFEFLKPVEVTLPHFLDIEDEADVSSMELAFLKSSCNLYCFHYSTGLATFKPKSQTAILRTTHFCSFCIAARKKVPTEKIHYRLVRIIPRLDEQHEQWRANFCVTYYLRTCLEALKRQYPEGRYEVKPLKRFKFPTSEHISVHFDRRLPGGWQLALETSDKIHAKSVEYQSVEAQELEVMEDEGQYPPRFEVLVCSSYARETVNAHILFKGIVTDDDSSDGLLTELVLQPRHLPYECNSLPFPPHMTSSQSMPAIVPQRSPKREPNMRPFPGKLTACPSHSALMSRVAAHLPSKWRLVGIQLNLSMATLDRIESYGDCMRCFSSVFSDWKCQGTAPYSWNTIINVLKSPSVQENVIAVNLEEELKDCYGSDMSCSSSTTCSSGYQSND